MKTRLYWQVGVHLCIRPGLKILPTNYEFGHTRTSHCYIEGHTESIPYVQAINKSVTILFLGQCLII